MFTFSNFFFLSLAVIAPWFLGYSIVRACLKNRFHFHYVAIGMGYFLSLIIVSLFSFKGSILSPDIPVIFFQYACFLIGLLICILFSPRQCYVGEQRRAPKIDSWKRMVIVLLFCVLVVLGVTVIIEVIKQVKIAEMTVLSVAHSYYLPFDVLNKADISIVNTSPTQMISVYLSYLAKSMNSWDVIYLSLPWILNFTSLGLLVFGSLRYVAVDIFVSFWGMFLIMTIPAFVFFSSTMSIDVFYTGFLFCLFTTFMHWIGLRENRQSILFIFFLTWLCLVYIDSVKLLIPIFFVLIYINYPMKWTLVFILLMISTFIPSLELSLSHLSYGVDGFKQYYDNFDKIIEIVFTGNRWSLLFYVLFVSFLCWLFLPYYKEGVIKKVCGVYFVLGICIFTLVAVFCLLTKESDVALEYLFDQYLVLFFPFFGMIPILTFELCHFKPSLS